MGATSDPPWQGSRSGEPLQSSEETINLLASRIAQLECKDGSNGEGDLVAETIRRLAGKAMASSAAGLAAADCSNRSATVPPRSSTNEEVGGSLPSRRLQRWSQWVRSRSAGRCDRSRERNCSSLDQPSDAEFQDPQAHGWARPRMPWPRRRSPKGMEQPRQGREPRGRNAEPTEMGSCGAEHNDAIRDSATAASLLELIERISSRVAHLEHAHTDETKGSESATSVADSISSLAARVLELEQQQEEQQQRPLPMGAECQTSPIPSAQAGVSTINTTIPIGYTSPMVIPAPGMPGMFMYAPMQQPQLCAMPGGGGPLTPRQW